MPRMLSRISAAVGKASLLLLVVVLFGAAGVARAAGGDGTGGSRAAARPSKEFAKESGKEFAREPAPAGRLPTAVVVDRVQRRYDAAQDFRAEFNQTLTSQAMNRQTRSAGEVLLKKPGLMRWNYRTPEARMYLSDGAVLWLYEPEDAQAFKQDLKSSQLPAALAFLTGTGKLAEQFEVEAVARTDPDFSKLIGSGNPRDYLLALHPRQAQPQIKAILFVVEPDTFEVRETVITDAQGNQNDVLFSNIRTNTQIPASTFRFTPPAGVRVIDTARLAK
jgi:outer membrane lipoprotein carrier protein